MTPEVAKLLAEIIAKEREDTSTRLDDKRCIGCGHTWSVTKYRTAARPPKWIPQANAWWHLRCWQEKLEREAKR